jgi:hypothetical protein
MTRRAMLRIRERRPSHHRRVRQYDCRITANEH